MHIKTGTIDASLINTFDLKFYLKHSELKKRKSLLEEQIKQVDKEIKELESATLI